MRVLLIAPPARRISLNISGVYAMPPLGLAYIAAVLKQDGFEVDILDMPALRLKPEGLSSYINKGDYSLCGISCNIFNLQDGFKVSQQVKRIDPVILTAIGGRCTVFPAELILKHARDIDIVVRGEGESLMLELSKRIAAKAGFDGIPRISYRNNGEIIQNNSDAVKYNLDSLPYPARELLPNERYKIHPPFNICSPITLMETSRGCSYNCNFCSLSEKVRQRSVSSLIAEIEQVSKDFGIKEIYFTDPNFTYNRQRVCEFCEQICRKNIKVVWTCKTRVDLVDGDLLKSMRSAGCYMISYGVESGSRKVLDSLNKGISPEHTHKAFSLTRQQRIRTLAYVLIASPGETQATFRETRELLFRIKPDFVLFGELLPDPASVLVQEAVQDGRTSLDELFDFYVFDKDIFSKTNLYGIDSSRVKYWLNTSNLRFYGRPAYLFSRLRDLRSFKDFFNMVQGAYFLIKDKLSLRADDTK